MSLSQPKLVNPCKKFIEFKGGEGVFQYWNKEKKENVKLEYPIKFIILDELATIKGFSEAFNASFYSNEVHNLQRQVLNVGVFKSQFKVSGLYADIKDKVKTAGGKYCRSLYAALLNGNYLELVNFQLTGAALSAWMDRDSGSLSHCVKVERTEHKKKGKVEYEIPVYESVTLSEELMQEARGMDKDLQVYLEEYEKRNTVSIKPESDESAQEDAKEDEDIPF